MRQLLNLLQEGVTAAHAIRYVKQDLLEKGFQELFLKEDWKLKENGKYYVNLYGTNCVAFTVGRQIDKEPLFRICMAHSDYPNFQIKPNPVLKGANWTKLNVEIYGGMYQKSWFDRPLGVAGRVVVRGKTAFTPEVLLYKVSVPLRLFQVLPFIWTGSSIKRELWMWQRSWFRWFPCQGMEICWRRLQAHWE